MLGRDGRILNANSHYVDLWVQFNPDPQSVFQDSQDCTEKLCLQKQNKKQTKTLISTQSFLLLMIICLIYLLCCVYLSQTPGFQQSSRLSLLGDYDHRSILLYLVQLCLLHICFEFKFLLFDSLLFTTGSIIAIAVLISKVSPLCILYTVIVPLYTLNYEIHYRAWPYVMLQ